MRDLVAANPVQVIHRRVQSDHAGNIGWAGHAAVRSRYPRPLLIFHVEDHLTAALVRRHRFEDLRPAIKDADAGGTAHFVAREGEEVTPDLLHVNGPMTRALGTID